jgi:hypothetical protein
LFFVFLTDPEPLKIVLLRHWAVHVGVVVIWRRDELFGVRVFICLDVKRIKKTKKGNGFLSRRENSMERKKTKKE